MEEERCGIGWCGETNQQNSEDHDSGTGRSYAVSFTLFVDAASPHEAFERAMQFRNILGTGDPADVRRLPFFWHLHDVEAR
jgi:hypothetical protein